MEVVLAANGFISVSSHFSMSLAIILSRYSRQHRASFLLSKSFERTYPAVPDDQPKKPSEKSLGDERQKNMESE